MLLNQAARGVEEPNLAPALLSSTKNEMAIMIPPATTNGNI